MPREDYVTNGNPLRMRRTSSTSIRASSGVTLPSGEVIPSRRSVSADRARWSSAPAARQKDRFVPLPAAGKEEALVEEDEEEAHLEQHLQALETADASSPMARQPSNEVTALSQQGKISVISSCGGFRRADVVEVLAKALPQASVTKYPEVLYLQTPFGSGPTGLGEVFIFDYGVVVFWSLDGKQQDTVMGMLVDLQEKPLLEKDVNREQFFFQYSADMPPHIQNDIITISVRESRDHQVKMAISHALAQSTKLTVYEESVAELVERVFDLPESLAAHGEIRMSQKQLAQLMGQVFIQKSEVNLLSSVLDTPDFFWSAPDALQTLYHKVTEYLELEERIELVNSRTMLIQSILVVCSDHASGLRLHFLDQIIIALIAFEVFLAFFEAIGFLRHLS